MGINESKQVGTLYHMTSLTAAVSILKDDMLKSNITSRNIGVDFRYSNFEDWEFSPWGGERYKKMDELTPFVCFTRDVRVRRMERDVVFVVNGDMLSHRYKITPYSVFDNKEEGNEKEERIYADIKNFSKYIIKMYIPKPKIDNLEDIEHEMPMPSGKIKTFKRIDGVWYDDGVKMDVDTNKKSPYERLIDLVEELNIPYELY